MAYSVDKLVSLLPRLIRHHWEIFLSIMKQIESFFIKWVFIVPVKSSHDRLLGTRLPDRYHWNDWLRGKKLSINGNNLLHARIVSHTFNFWGSLRLSSSSLPLDWYPFVGMSFKFFSHDHFFTFRTRLCTIVQSLLSLWRGMPPLT